MKLKSEGLTALIIGFAALFLFTSGQDPAAQPLSMENHIPVRMKPNTILKYDEQTKPSVTYDLSAIITSPDAEPSPHKTTNTPVEITKVEGDNGKAEEDKFFESIKKEAESLPVFDLGYDLPEPEPGLVVIYGTDGYINRYYNENETSKGH